MRRRKRKKELLRKERRRDKKMKQQDKIKELLEGEPELAEINEDLICPVCLDLLHEPFLVDPCGHIFCEPCLRRLGQKNPMNCTCPMCRTKIFFCKHQAPMAKEIRENHHGLYMKRKKFERSTPVFQYPLPWQPGWRNLLSGRPLGGNNLLRDNRVDWMRTILHQIPYYIPPVIIANIINIGIFAFMMGFIEIFPNLLALVFGTSRNMSLILNSTMEAVLENSGDTGVPVDPSDSSSVVTSADPAADIIDTDTNIDTDIIDNMDSEAKVANVASAMVVFSIVLTIIGEFIRMMDRDAFNRRPMTLILFVSAVSLSIVIPFFFPFRVGPKP